MPRSYPPEFRSKVLDLLKAGRTVAQVAHDLVSAENGPYPGCWTRGYATRGVVSDVGIRLFS